ncbi:hypothetical protein GCM10011384_43610 [Psychrobacillus lasiicapitis]|nr:hypothetical protein GCM10011384_43610 [Psychrobacillus lasiicapitis]
MRGKGDKEREVYFNTRCDIWLKRYMESRNDHNPAIFVTARQPHKMSVAEVIQSLMGNEKSETTRIYAQLSGRLRKEYYQKYF